MNYLKRKLLILKKCLSNIVTSSISGVPPLILTAAQKIVGIEVKGNTAQNGVPTPDMKVDVVGVGDTGAVEEYAIPLSVSGKNLFDINAAKTVSGCSASISGNTLSLQTSTNLSAQRCMYTFSCVPNTVYTLSFRCDMSEVPLENEVAVMVRETVSGGGTLGLKTVANADGEKVTSDTLTFTSGDRTQFTIWFMARRNTVTQAQSYSVKYWDIQLEENKNIFNQEYFVEYVNTNANPAYQITSETIDEKNCIKVFGLIPTGAFNFLEFSENTPYTISFDYYDVLYNGASGLLLTAYYTDGSTERILSSRTSGDIWKHLSWTSAEGKTLERIDNSYATGYAYTYLSDFQIVARYTQTDYEPYYQSQTFELYTPAPLYKIDDLADTLSLDLLRHTAILTQNISSIVLTGDESWQLYSTGTDTIAFRANLLYANWYLDTVYCSHFKRLESATTDEEGFAHIGISMAVVFRINKETAPDIEAFKQWLAEQNSSGNPVTLYYKSTSSTDTDVSSLIDWSAVPSLPETAYIDVGTNLSPSNLTVEFI